MKFTFILAILIQCLLISCGIYCMEDLSAPRVEEERISETGIAVSLQRLQRNRNPRAIEFEPGEKPGLHVIIKKFKHKGTRIKTQKPRLTKHTQQHTIDTTADQTE